MRNLTLGTFLAFIIAVLIPTATLADVIKGKVVDAETKQPLQGVDVELSIKTDNMSMTSITSTDSTGSFMAYANVEGRIMMTFKLIGYHTSHKVDYSSGDAPDTINVGTISLRPTAIMMQEVQVSAKMPRFTMSGDTIVFHPEAFKLPEGARLSDLIRKLPGVEERDGGLYWNGMPLRMMMNGKDIFGGGAMVSQLPAEVAEKIKLYDRKSEESRHTGRDEGEENNVLDIVIKPGFLDKWYGSIEAGGMTGLRYKAEGRANYLSDHDPWMVYAQANDQNETMEVTPTWSSMGNIDNFGKSQYGSVGRQHYWKTKDTDKYSPNNVWGSASLGHADGWNDTHTLSRRFMPGEETTTQRTDSKSSSHSLAPKITSELYTYTTPKNTIQMGLDAQYGRNRSNSSSTTTNYYGSDALQAINSQRQALTNTDDNGRANLNFNWTHYEGRKGSYGLGGSVTAATSMAKTYISRELEYYSQDSTSDNRYQYYRTPTRSLSANLKGSFDRWLSDVWYVKLSDNISYISNRTSRDIYSSTVSFDEISGDTNADIANSMHNTAHKYINDLTANVTISPVKTLKIMPALTWRLQSEHSRYRYGSLDTAAVRNTSLLQPSISLKWTVSKVRKFYADFSYSTSNPDLTSTFAFTDTTDPLYTSMGNSDLRQSHSYNASASYLRMWPRKQTMLKIAANYSHEINPVSTLLDYDTTTGAYTSKPMNVKGGDAIGASLNYDQGIGFYMRLANILETKWSRRYGYLTRTTAEETPGLNRQRTFYLKNNTEVSYENDFAQLSAYNNLLLNSYHYSSSPTANSTPLTMKYGVSARIKPQPLEFYVKVYDEFRTGYLMPDMNGHNWVVNAGASWSLCKGKLLLSVDADDIFNNMRTRYASYGSYETTEQYSEYLHHYVAVSVKYTFDAKGR